MRHIVREAVTCGFLMCYFHNKVGVNVCIYSKETHVGTISLICGTRLQVDIDFLGVLARDFWGLF